jgi:hypothetical protein
MPTIIVPPFSGDLPALPSSAQGVRASFPESVPTVGINPPSPSVQSSMDQHYHATVTLPSQAADAAKAAVTKTTNIGQQLKAFIIAQKATYTGDVPLGQRVKAFLATLKAAVIPPPGPLPPAT